MEINPKRQLLDQLTTSRVILERDARHVRSEWDFQQKATMAVRSNPVKWLGAAAFSGYLIAKLRGRGRPAPAPRKSEKSASGKTQAAAPPARKFGIFAGLIGLIRLLSPVLRPILLSYVSKTVTKYAART